MRNLRNLLAIASVVALSGLMSSCITLQVGTTASKSAAYTDDLYGTHDRVAIAAAERALAEQEAAEAAAVAAAAAEREKRINAMVAAANAEADGCNTHILDSRVREESFVVVCTAQEERSHT